MAIGAESSYNEHCLTPSRFLQYKAYLLIQLPPIICNVQYSSMCNTGTIIVTSYNVLFNTGQCNTFFFPSSYTFERVKQNSEKLWWYERFTAINDYKWRIASPFNLIFIPTRIYTICRKIKCCPRSNNSTFLLFESIYYTELYKWDMQLHHQKLPKQNLNLDTAEVSHHFYFKGF